MGIQWGFRLRFGDSVFWRSVFASVFLVWAGDSTVTTYPFIILEGENTGVALPVAGAPGLAPLPPPLGPPPSGPPPPPPPPVADGLGADAHDAGREVGSVQIPPPPCLKAGTCLAVGSCRVPPPPPAPLPTPARPNPLAVPLPCSSSGAAASSHGPVPVAAASPVARGPCASVAPPPKVNKHSKG